MFIRTCITVILVRWCIIPKKEFRNHVSRHSYNESINAFAVDIYYSCLQHGPDGVRTAPSYFHLGRVFQTYHQMKDRTEAFYKKVVDNCVGFLEKKDE